MWDDQNVGHAPLSHDFPCPCCGHAGHQYLPCDRNCDCEGAPMLAPAVVRVGVRRAG